MAIVRRKRKDGSITYQVKVKDRGGRWLPSSSFTSLVEARKAEAEIFEIKAKGNGQNLQDARDTSYAEYWEVWSQANRDEVSEGWRISQDQMNRDYVMPVLGELLMADITKADIGKVLNRMTKKGLSQQMKKHVYTLMHTVFSDAVDFYDMLKSSPVKAKHHAPSVARKERRFLEPHHLGHLLDKAREHYYLGPPVWVQALAGLRVEAMIGLSWRSIHWNLNQILICRAWKAKVGRLEDYPKGKNWEYVPLTPALKEYLWEKWQASRKDPDDFVCPGPNGGMLSYDTYQKAIKPLCRKAGVTELTSHELRHSTSELYVQFGATSEDIRRLLNHKSLETTQRYMHRTDSRLSSIAASVRLTAIEGGQAGRFPSEFPNGKQKAYASDDESVAL